MAGLLGGVLPAIYSGADQLKRQIYGLLTNPNEMAQRAGQNLLQTHAENQALMSKAHGNPQNPLQITDPTAFSELTNRYMAGVTGVAPIGMIAYHGTPHTIQGKFDISKVGTGEGAQAYGHGMYFAEARPVAETYKKEFNQSDASIRALQKFRDNYEVNSPDWVHYDNLMKRNNAGNLYKVDIPDEHIPTMMDWDKPLGQQSAFVKKAINNLKKQVTPEMKMELGGDLNLLFGKDITPSQFLNTWEIIHPTGGTGIGEKLLNEQGVKGIRYLDNASRDAGKGTSNFVVFDPTDVKILERNDQPIESLLGK